VVNAQRRERLYRLVPRSRAPEAVITLGCSSICGATFLTLAFLETAMQNQIREMPRKLIMRETLLDLPLSFRAFKRGRLIARGEGRAQKVVSKHFLVALNHDVPQSATRIELSISWPLERGQNVATLWVLTGKPLWEGSVCTRVKILRFEARLVNQNPEPPEPPEPIAPAMTGTDRLSPARSAVSPQAGPIRHVPRLPKRLARPGTGSNPSKVSFLWLSSGPAPAPLTATSEE